MNKELFQFDYDVYDSSAELNEHDRALLGAAQQASTEAYAPYSSFNVGAAAELFNGEIITGSNQENISFPAGLCAEGVVLAVASSRFPNVPINTLAISYHCSKAESDHPIAPCGICRQSLQEFRERTGAPVRLILGGMKGKIIIVPDASSLLPFAFKF
jgi:cytidine deaminase